MGVGAGGGWEDEGGQYHLQGDKQQCVVSSVGHRTVTVNLIDRDSR